MRTQARWLNRLRSEQGMALPLALGIMMVLTITVGAMLQFSSSSARGASLNLTRQSAKALAEGGVGHGSSVLAKQMQTSSSFTGNLSGTATIQGVNVPWTATYQSASPPTWIVSATAAPFNPTGPAAAPVSRTVQARFSWTTVTDFSAWRGVYAANQGSDCFMQNAVVVKTPIYIKQTDSSTVTCIKNEGTKFLGNYLAIRGGAGFRAENPAATIGQPASTSQPGEPGYPGEYRVPDVHITSQCLGSPCTESHQVYRCLTGAPCYDNVVDDVPKPTFNFTTARTAAKPGPVNGCTVSSGSVPSFSSTGDVEIMGAAYNCERWEGGVLMGKIQWQPGTFTESNPNGTHGTLTIAGGPIYFSGKLKFSKVYGQVSGTALIYVQDSIMMESDLAALCGKADTTPGYPRCDSSWDPGTTTDMAWFITGSTGGTSSTSMNVKNTFELQASVWTAGKFILENDASFKGPLVTEKVELKNDSTIDAWSPLNSAPSGYPAGTTGALKLVPGTWSG